MWASLPDDLQHLVMDFYGDSSVLAHRRFRFVRAELKTVFMLLQGPSRFAPSFARSLGRIVMLKQLMQLTYLEAQEKALFKTHGTSRSGMP